MDFIKRMIAAAVVGSGLLAATSLVQAQTWPSRTVRIVIPFGAGGAGDITARFIAQDLSQRWGQPVIVDNKPGGDTIIAASEVQRAAPDGYTLLMTINSTLTLTPFTMKVPFNPATDFTYIGQLTDVPMLVLVNDSIAPKSLPAFIDYARSRPGQLNAGGTATVTQLVQEQFAREAGLKFAWVAYKSGAETTRAVLANEIDLAIDAVPNNLPHLQSGKLRALAVTTSTRLASLPNVPTLQELGIKDQRVTLKHILLGPRGMQPELLAKIERDVQATLASAAVREKILAGGVQVHWRSGVELAKSVQVESPVTAELVQSIGLKP